MLVTVLTTTYNRAYTLGNLYESLKRQTCKDFEWILIDDGSVDDTKKMVDNWRANTEDFDIIYRYVRNGGKHRGLNIGTELAKGEAIVNVDSDDVLADDAIEFVVEHFREVENDERYAGISGMKAYTNGEIIGGETTFDEYVDANSYEFDFHIHVGDKAEAYKTSILRKYPFPEYEGENFMSEGAVFFRIAYDGYLVRWYNKVIEYCEYLPDGLTRNSFSLIKNNPKGWAEYMRSRNLFGEDIKEQSKRISFVLMRDVFTKEELCELLMINSEKYLNYKNEYKVFIKRIKKLLKDQNIKKIAVYGCGRNAQFFVECLEELDVDFLFGIDRNTKLSTFQVIYSIDDNLPFVDAVFITPSKLSEREKKDICDMLERKQFAKYIISLSEIASDYFA